MGEYSLPHVAHNVGNPLHGADSRLGHASLKSGLDGVDRSVAHGTHGTTDQTTESCLPVGQIAAFVLWLLLVESLLKVGISREVDGLVGTLA